MSIRAQRKDPTRTTVTIKMSQDYYEHLFTVAATDSRSVIDYIQVTVEDKNPALREIRKKELLREAGLLD